MAQYKIKKNHIIHVCTESLSQILEQRKKIKESKKWYHEIFQPVKTKSEVEFYRWSDSCFCEEHLTACLMSHGTYVVMSESECHKMQKLWEEFCYDLKK